jgi:glycosyltransferase involved in cell wall biosynthesis
LPPGRLNRVIDRVVFRANWTAARLAHAIVAYTQDYADHSELLSRFPEKIRVIPPPVVMPAPSTDQVAAFRAAHALNGRPTLGFVTRLAAEKGVEHLVDAMPALLERFPDLKVLFAGQYRDVMGEEAYWRSLQPRIAALGEHWEFLGILRPDELPPFYGALDSLLVPSVNSTESFGLVQVEAMLCGTPVVASALPGVRQPVLQTGMGEVVPPADSAALAGAVIRVLTGRDAYLRPRAEIERRFDLDATLDAYEALFDELRQRG